MAKQSAVRQSSVASRQSSGSRQSTAGGRQPARQSPGGRQLTGSRQSTDSAQSAVGELDRLIHERLRLGIISALAVNDRLTFNELKALLDATDGNLSVHARRLEEAQYIACEKTFEGRMPKSEYRITAAGRRALDKYLAHMEALIKAVRV